MSNAACPRFFFTHMKKFLFPLLAILVLASCGDDIIGPANNTNSNATIVQVGNVQMVSETNNLNLEQTATRLEMPALRGGAANLFVVHTATGYGINYAMEYDQTVRASRWTAFRTYKGFSSNEKNWNRNNWDGTIWNGVAWDGDPFQEDPLIPKEYRTTLEEHSRDGHDCGHMLGSADRLNSMESNGQTFYLSNMHPQLAGFNQRGIWYNLENKIRNTWDKDNFRDTLYIVKGGTIAQGQYHKNRTLVIPNHFYMALLCKSKNWKDQGGYAAIAFWMEHKENNDTDFKKYAISIDELERKTGIDFFCNLPDNLEGQIERNMIPSVWKLY